MTSHLSPHRPGATLGLLLLTPAALWAGTLSTLTHCQAGSWPPASAGTAQVTTPGHTMEGASGHLSVSYSQRRHYKSTDAPTRKSPQLALQTTKSKHRHFLQKKHHSKKCTKWLQYICFWLNKDKWPNLTLEAPHAGPTCKLPEDWLCKRQFCPALCGGTQGSTLASGHGHDCQ